MTVPMMFQPLVKYAQFEGRSRRSEFWLWVLFRLLVGMAFGVLALVVILPAISEMAAKPHMDEAQGVALMSRMFIVYPVAILVGLGLFLPTLAVSVRRLHDINRSGWWILMPAGVVFGGGIVLMIVGVIMAVSMAAAHPDPHVTGGEGLGTVLGFVLVYACYLIAILAAGIVMLVFYVTEGTKGPNRFGADPKASVAGAV